MPKVQEVPKKEVKCPSLAWGLPFIGSDLFILTSMVMFSITMEVIHMYVSLAMKLSKYLTGLLCIVFQQLIKAHVKLFMCDALSTQVNTVHEKFTPSALRLYDCFLYLDRCILQPDGCTVYLDGCILCPDRY